MGGPLSAHTVIKVEQIDRLHKDKAFDYRDATTDFWFRPRSFEEGVRAEVAMIQRKT